MYQNRIKQYREEQGITMKEIAEKCGISAGYLCHLEKGRRANPSTEVMEKIARALNKTIPEVFFSNELL